MNIYWEFHIDSKALNGDIIFWKMVNRGSIYLVYILVYYGADLSVNISGSDT